MLARLRTIDTDLKRAAFVVAGMCALMFVAGIVLFVVTGDAGLMAAAVAVFSLIFGGVAILAGLWQVSVRIFPSQKED
ncbi:hypothetical protein [Micromonospora sp. NPDC005174]|uniref:hypothetical protein n=1 Tax=Micromonospora sp. NPDC005174 TaxID=3157018 RepID=UPI0033BCED24